MISHPTLLLALALALVTGHARTADELPLTLDEVVLLVQVGADDAEILAAARRRGTSFSWSDAIDASLAAAGVGDAIRRELASLARPPAADLPAGRSVFDPAAGTTFHLPTGWDLVFGDDATEIVRRDPPLGLKVSMTYKVLELPRDRLRAKGIPTLDDYHALRVEEIRRDHLDWTWLGTWPLQAYGRTGLHTVFEYDRGALEHVTICLTWFVSGDHVLSLSSRLVETPGHPDHDLMVDEMTLVLTGHVGRAVDDARLRELHALRERETWLVTDADRVLTRRRRLAGEATTLRAVSPERAVSGSGHDVVVVEDGALLTLGADGGGEARRLLESGLPILAVETSALLRDRIVAWRRDRSGFARPSLVDSREPRAVETPLDLDGLLGGALDSTAFPPTLVAIARASGNALELRRYGLDAASHVTLGPPFRLDGVDGIGLVTDGRLIWIVASRPAGDDRELRLLRLDPSGETASRTLWSAIVPATLDDGLDVVLSPTGLELYVLAPDLGLLAFGRDGGLPVRLAAADTIRSFAVVR